MHLGYSEEDAVLQVTLAQTLTSRRSFVTRYGEEIGGLKYDKFVALQKANSKRCVEYWKKLGHTDDAAILLVVKYQSALSNLGPHALAYWLNLGYSIEDAEICRYESIAKKFANTIFYWADRGYAEADAVKLVKGIQSARGVKGAYAQRFRFKSSLEKKFNALVDGVAGKIWTSHVRDSENNKNYFPDFEFNGCYVEICGDYWHANPAIHGNAAKMAYGKVASQIWEHDALRIARITEITNKPVFIIWESELNDTQLTQDKLNEFSKYF